MKDPSAESDSGIRVPSAHLPASKRNELGIPFLLVVYLPLFIRKIACHVLASSDDPHIFAMFHPSGIKESKYMTNSQESNLRRPMLQFLVNFFPEFAEKVYALIRTSQVCLIHR